VAVTFCHTGKLSWGCTDEPRTAQLLAEIYQSLGADTQEDKQCAQETVHEIIHGFQEIQKLEKDSPKLAESRLVFDDLARVGGKLRKKIRESLRHLDAGFGGATNEIIDNVDSPTRLARDDEREYFAGKWRALAADIEKLLDETKAYAAGWKEPKAGRLNVESNRSALSASLSIGSGSAT
jgi:hypothetical protein